MQSKLRSKAMMSHVSAAVAQRMAYKDMSNVWYYGATLTMYGIAVLGAIGIENVATIFDFVSAISVSAIAFFIPSIFYFKVQSKFPGNLENQKRNNCLSYLFFVLGCLNFCIGITSTVYGIVSGEGGGE